MNTRRRDVNQTVAKVFGATLIATGVAGFVIPAKKAMTSGAPAYNTFHIVFGMIGLAASRNPRRARSFNVGFGAIDLYQAVASRRSWFPQRMFRWKPADDVLHIVIGAGLVGAGLVRHGRPPVKGDVR
ncbi:MAG TPA: DUF4383 domain-containing protein [Ilumatobacteraceae bacterium]